MEKDLRDANRVVGFLLIVILVLVLVWGAGCTYRDETEKEKVENGIKEVAVFSTAIFLGLIQRAKENKEEAKE
jgi:uncharacterized membrane protein